jgi:hypothetical protein
MTTQTTEPVAYDTQPFEACWHCPHLIPGNRPHCAVLRKFADPCPVRGREKAREDETR